MLPELVHTGKILLLPVSTGLFITDFIGLPVGDDLLSSRLRSASPRARYRLEHHESSSLPFVHSLPELSLHGPI